jgi:hypothetical protein
MFTSHIRSLPDLIGLAQRKRALFWHASRLCIGHTKDRDNQADEQDSGAGKGIGPQVEEPHDKYDDGPDHRYRSNDGQVDPRE